VDTVEGLRDAARRARECLVIGQAVCVAFQGDSPVEYWDEERPRKPTPFGLTKVNRRLAALGREVT
jgi:hypothetical protein